MMLRALDAVTRHVCVPRTGVRGSLSPASATTRVRRDTGAVSRLVTTYSTLGWSPDGRLVTKTRRPAVDARRRFRNELRVNRLLNSHRLPVLTPALVACDIQRRQ